jgi:hypothetical protein
MKAMGKAAFTESMRAVLEILAEMIGVQPGELQQAGMAA